LVFNQPFFNEFYVKYDGDIETLYQRFIDAGILGGVRMEDGLIIAVTEKRTKEEIDNFVKIAAL
jgi:glycine dehydrogenase subunit 1